MEGLTLTDLEHAARAYVAAHRACEDTDGRDWLPARLALDVAFHDLVLVAGFPCRSCEEGSCPGNMAESQQLQAIAPEASA